MVELLEFEPSAGGDDEGAAGEEGFAGAREMIEKGYEAALVGVGEGNQKDEGRIMKDEIGEPEILRFFLDPSYFILSLRVHGGLLGGEEEDVVVVTRPCQLGGADG